MDTMKIEQTKKIIIDSVVYIRSGDVSAFYADLADKQATMILQIGFMIESLVYTSLSTKII